MPRKDGTGPMGLGPMTGRGRGFCIKSDVSAVFIGSGLACIRGFRRRFGGGNYSGNISAVTEKELLNEE